MTLINLLSILTLGFFLGMRHATDPDHVVAITTIVSRYRSVSYAALIGCLWGLRPHRDDFGSRWRHHFIRLGDSSTNRPLDGIFRCLDADPSRSSEPDGNSPNDNREIYSGT